MIDHVWTVLCSKSIIDKDSNNISLLEIIEQIAVSGSEAPAVAPIRMELVSLWSRTDLDKPSRGRARISLVKPDGSLHILQFEFEIDLTNYRRSRTRAQMGGIPISKPGRHYFQVELQIEGEEGWKEVSRTPLEVVFQGPGQ